MLTLLLAPPLRDWYVQHQELKTLHAQQDQARREVSQLQAQQRRWEDPEYIKAQARERLHYAMPGETPLVATGGVNPDGSPVTGEAASAWYDGLWTSVQAAGGVDGVGMSDQQLLDSQGK